MMPESDRLPSFFDRGSPKCWLHLWGHFHSLTFCLLARQDGKQSPPQKRQRIFPKAILTGSSNLAFLTTALDLSPELTHRLVVLNSLLELGDMELVAAAAARLEPHRGEEPIESILQAIAGHRYADAVALISRLLSAGTRLARWSDPEFDLLEVELEKLTAELAEIEAEQAELEHLVARFQAAHNEALGDRIAKLLKLRMRWLERLLRLDPAKQAAFEEAKRDYEDFWREEEFRKETDARSDWELTDEEKQELRKLFRQASKKCHPDLVPPEHHDAAAQMFRELRKAYDEGALVRLRHLAERAETGLFASASDQDVGDAVRKERLRARITGIRETVESAKAALAAMKGTSTYRTMTESTDWFSLFEKQAELLDQEIENLRENLEGVADANA